MSAGYSGTPLAKKLGIAVERCVVLIGAPGEYKSLLRPLSREVRFGLRVSQATDIVHVFCTRRAELQKMLACFREVIRPTAAIWVSWPKKSSKVPTDVTEDTIREVALPLGFVEVKVCAINDVWSGLKLVVREELR